MSKMKHFCIVLLFFCLMMMAGCSQETSEKKTDYVVVEIPEDYTVEQLFQFESVSHNALNGASGWGVSDGVYNIGTLENGDTIVWRSDDVMVYIKETFKTTQIVQYAGKLNEEPVSYEEFKEMYGD